MENKSLTMTQKEHAIAFGNFLQQTTVNSLRKEWLYVNKTKTELKLTKQLYDIFTDKVSKVPNLKSPKSKVLHNVEFSLIKITPGLYDLSINEDIWKIEKINIGNFQAWIGENEGKAFREKTKQQVLDLIFNEYKTKV